MTDNNKIDKKIDFSEEENKNIQEFLMNLQDEKLNILITGATGSGKSSTINAMFNTEKAKVGTGVDPETMSITKFELGNMILWDSPGLGDGSKDAQHSKAITKKLQELDDNKQPLIDLVLVIVNASNRDLGTSYELINKIIIPNLGENNSTRLLIAINQADRLLQGPNPWDYINNKPTPKAEEKLNEKVISIKNRIKEATNVNVDPIYYCAGYQEDDEIQAPYNLSKLLYLIVKHAPKKKRLLLADNISQDDTIWEEDDGQEDYAEKIKKTFMESLAGYILKGVEIAKSVGEIAKVFSETINLFRK